MSDDRLPSHLWITGIIRQENSAGRPILLLRRGEKMGGGLLVKINSLDGSFRILVQQRDLDGRLGWMGALQDAAVTEPEADAYIERACSRDPDLWAVEVERRDGVNPFSAGPERL
ncbi:MAG: DUF1491 family protein [Kiloniellales bacterium]